MIIDHSSGADGINALQKRSKSTLSSDQHERAAERLQRPGKVGKRLLEPPPGAAAGVEAPLLGRAPYEDWEHRAVPGGGGQSRVVVDPEVPPEPHHGPLRPAHRRGSSVHHDPAQEKLAHRSLRSITSSTTCARPNKPPEGGKLQRVGIKGQTNAGS